MEVQELMNKLLNNISNYSKEDIDEIKKAFILAESLHAGQKRQSGEDYITHPLHVAIILS